MDNKIIRYKIDDMPYQSGESVGVYIRKLSDIKGMPHLHDCYEIEVIAGGKVNETINSVTFSASPGHAFLIAPNDFHQLSEMEDLEMYNIMFREDIIQKQYLQILSEQDINQNVFCHFNKEEYRFVISILEKAIEEYQKRDRYFENILSGIINMLISMMLRNYSFRISDNMKDYDIRKAMAYMQQNYRENPSLEEVANHVGLNRTYFSDKFHQSVGITFKAYLTEWKLSHARQNILSSNRPVSEICFANGFSSLPHFYREFKKKYGMSPQEMRKNARAGEDRKLL